MRNPTKIDENSIKNPLEIHENQVHGGVLGRLWGVFGVMLVESDRFWSYFGSNLEGLGRILAPRGRVLGRFGLQVGAQNGAKSVPRAGRNVIGFVDRFDNLFSGRLGANLAPS